MKDTLFKCIKTLLIDQENDVAQINVGSTWIFVPISPEGYDVALEDNDDEDSAAQIWTSFAILDEYFEEIVG